MSVRMDVFYNIDETTRPPLSCGYTTPVLARVWPGWTEMFRLRAMITIERVGSALYRAGVSKIVSLLVAI